VSPPTTTTTGVSQMSQQLELKEMDATHAALNAAFQEVRRLKLRIATYHDKHRQLQAKYLDVCSKLNRIACVLKGDSE